MALTRSQLMRIKENRRYWRDREAKQREAYIRTDNEELTEINRVYDEMYRWAEREINAFYGKYATAEGIDITEAKRKVSQLDIAEYEKLAKEYVKDRDFSPQANAEMRLYNATMKINRLELLKAQIGLKLVDGINDIDKHWEKIATERATQEIIRQSGILGKTLTDTETARTAKQIVNADFYNATFSQRIWSHMDNLKSDLAIELQKGFIAGVSSREMARRLKEHAFDKSEKDAFRLARTELRRIQTDVAKDNYERNGIEQYEYMAVNPSACPICRELDGRIFDVAKMKAGLNAPPIHPNCHCTTAPHIDDNEYEQWLTWLEKGGTTEQWDAMSDRDRRNWYDKIVGNLPKEDGFKPATTIAEAEEYAKSFTDGSRFGALGVSYDGLSVEVANIVNKTVGDFYKKYKVDKFGGIQAPKGNTKLGKLVANATAGYSPVRHGFLLNRKSLKDIKTAEKGLRENNEVVRKYYDNPNRYNVDKLSKRVLQVLENSKQTMRATVPTTIEEVLWHELGHSLEKPMRNVSNYNEIKDRMKDYAPKISGYACDSFSEYLAESFCAHKKGEKNVDPMLIKAFKELER